AQLTQLLSQIKEKNGLIAEAADILQEVHVETYGAMTKLEKVEFILEQVRLTLAKKDYVRAFILSKKILRRVLEEENFEAVKIKFYRLMIEYDTHENNPLELCRHWQSIFSTKTLAPAEKAEALQHAMIFAVISPHSNLQQDMLFKLANEPLRFDLPVYETLMKLFTNKEIIPYPLPVQAQIQSHAIFADFNRGQAWLEDLHTRTTEHNIRVVATHYQRIRLPHLANMIGLSEEITEARISSLVSSASIYAKIDRPAKIVYFQKPQSPEELLTNCQSKIVMKVIIVPGNGCTPIACCNWYAWLADKIRSVGHEAVLRDMPDPYVARESIWIPFMKNELGCDENSIIVGHSSGAEAAMRFAEKNKVHGLVLASACATDLGDANERASGYYSRPWEFQKIKANAQWIIQFGSPDDPFLPIAEQNEVAHGLQADYYCLEERGHYMNSDEPDIWQALSLKLV
ncbi:26S proteasome non-ATPase regulatory subunit 12, partial [Thraustotheca clavata]